MHIGRSGSTGHGQIHLSGLVDQSRLGVDIDPAIMHTDLFHLQILYNKRILYSGISLK